MIGYAEGVDLLEFVVQLAVERLYPIRILRLLEMRLHPCARVLEFAIHSKNNRDKLYSNAEDRMEGEGPEGEIVMVLCLSYSLLPQYCLCCVDMPVKYQ